jgi:MoxR-like ATPase
LDDLKAVVTAEQLIACQREVRDVFVDPKIQQYLMQIVHDTRGSEELSLGASPRASIALFRTAQAMAAIRGRNFVQPDDLKYVAPAVLTHRVILKPESRLRKITAEYVVSEIIAEIAVPTLGN